MMALMSGLRAELAMLIERGGWVMLPLMVLSIISLALIVERIWFWIALHRPKRIRWLQRLRAAMRAGDRAAAGKLLAKDRSPYSQVGHALHEHGAGDAVAVEAVELVRPKFDRFMVSLSTIITAAPLLGILGTVIGIIRSFRLLGGGPGAGGLTDPSAVSMGIAEALLTTALGLVVALITLFPYMIFKAQAERALGRVESIIAAAQQGASLAAEKGRSTVQVETRLQGRETPVVEEASAAS
jgi:biopolymer transport protein ExbB